MEGAGTIGAAVARYFASDDKVQAAYLFGSCASGTSGPLSDADVAVLGPATSDGVANLELRARYAADLEGILRCPVDVVLLEDADTVLTEEVLRHGILLLEKDREAHVRWKASQISRILDFLPTRARLERGLSASLKRCLHGAVDRPL